MKLLKVGGAALKHSLQSDGLWEYLCHSTTERLLVVHGGGPAIGKLSEAMGLKPRFVEGLRYTSLEEMDLVEMALSGSSNSHIVRALQRHGRSNSVGLSGVDAQILQAKLLDSDRFGLVGKVNEVNGAFLQGILKEHDVVLSPVAVAPTELYQALNVNADHAALALAIELKADELIFYSDTDGIYDENKKPLRQLKLSEVQKLMDSDSLQGGMRVKAEVVIEYLKALPTGKASIRSAFDLELPGTVIAP